MKKFRALPNGMTLSASKGDMYLHRGDHIYYINTRDEFKSLFFDFREMPDNKLVYKLDTYFAHELGEKKRLDEDIIVYLNTYTKEVLTSDEYHAGIFRGNIDKEDAHIKSILITHRFNMTNYNKYYHLSKSDMLDSIIEFKQKIDSGNIDGKYMSQEFIFEMLRPQFEKMLSIP